MTVKHTAQYHLKQLDKIAKTGIVPEEYKKIFSDTKDPVKRIKDGQSKINSAIREDIKNTVKEEKRVHKTHIKDGIKFDENCVVCNSKDESKEVVTKIEENIDVEETIEEKPKIRKSKEEKIKIKEEKSINPVEKKTKNEWDDGW